MAARAAPCPSRREACVPVASAGAEAGSNSKSSTCSASQETPAEVLLSREEPLRVLHRRSKPLAIDSRSLAQGMDGGRRLDALAWLVQAFDAKGLPDAQLFVAFGLLDRYAAASSEPICAGPSAFTLVLASMLVALKATGTQRDLDTAKQLVTVVSNSRRPWGALRKAELSILRRLQFKACTPTSRDLLDQLLAEAAQSQAWSSRQGGSWEGELCARCEDLAKFLLELGVVHEPEVLYGPGHPPLTAALAALLLALVAMGAPQRRVEALREAVRQLDIRGPTVVKLAEAMRQRWAVEDQHAKSGGKSTAVLEKWSRRMGSFGVSPPSPGQLRQCLIAGVEVGEARRLQLLAHFAEIGKARRNEETTVVEFMSSLPTPLRNASGQSGSRGLAVGARAVQLEQRQQRQHSACDLECKENNAAASQLTLLAPADTQSEAMQLVLPHGRSLREELQGLHCSPAAAPILEAEDAPNSQADGAAKPSLLPVRDRADMSPSPQMDCVPSERPFKEMPLMDLSHILNMSQPADNQQTAGGPTSVGKHQPAPVDTKVLLSSALRMRWPRDGRQQGPSDAAVACREAAEALSQASTRLLDTACRLEQGKSTASIRASGPIGDIEAKRRRTSGGNSTLAVSPPVVGGQCRLRGSPPAAQRAGLRV